MLENLTPPTVVRTCKVQRITAGLSDSDRKILQGAIADQVTWKTHVLVAELQKRGIDMSESTLRKHRRAECSCGVSNA